MNWRIESIRMGWESVVSHKERIKVNARAQEREREKSLYNREALKTSGKETIKRSVSLAGWAVERSHLNDNQRTHRHLDATIVKLAQVKCGSFENLLEGRTGAGYRLGIIVPDDCFCFGSITRVHVTVRVPSGWSMRRHRFINRV